MKGKWIFPSTNGGEKQGLNNTGIEQFKDNPIRSLAREICQNSLDAAENYPVIVEFNTFSLPRSKFPCCEEFSEILNSCREFKKDNKDAKDFFDKAIQCFNGKEIEFLRISDFSTTGLDENNWGKLVEESGESNKTEEKSGSFGIGKHAPFACSALRTVFYSSYDKNRNKRSKGVSRLTSHIIGQYDDGTDNISQGTGYYGIEGPHRIDYFEESLNLDPKFNRNEAGTDVYVAGFGNDYDRTDILYMIEAEIIDGFLMAIWEEKLCIKINGKEINKKSIVDDTLKRELSSYLNKTTLLNMELLADKDLSWAELAVSFGNISMGSLKVAIQIREDDAKGINKISMVRSSGMKIFDKEGLCPLFRFTGICVIQGKELNDYLRKLENASHNKWSIERNNKKQSQMLLNLIFTLISNHLKQQALEGYDDEIDVAGASDYIPDIDEDVGKQRKIKNIGFSKITEIKIRQKTKVESNSHMDTKELGDNMAGQVETQGRIVEDGKGYNARIKDGKHHKHHGEKDEKEVGRENDGESSITQNRNVKSKQIRIFYLKDSNQYKLIFYPIIDSEEGYIEINRVAENDDKMPINILGYKFDENLRIDKNRIGSFKFIKDEKIAITLDLDIDEYSTMEVKLYAYKS